MTCKIKHKNFFQSLTIVLVMGLLLYICFGFYYSLNDDSTLGAILSGAITGQPDAHCVYILYPLASVIKLLYNIFPSLPVFGLLEVASYLISGFLLLYFSIKYVDLNCIDTPTKPLKGFLILLFCGLTSVFMKEVVFEHYSVTAALIFSTGIFLFVLSGRLISKKSANNKKLCIFLRFIAIILAVIGFFLREQMILLATPVMAGVILCYWLIILKEHKNNLKSFFKLVCADLGVLVITIIIAFCGLLIHNRAYSAEDYKAYMEFNDMRTEIYDYQRYIPPYDQYKDFYVNNNINYGEFLLLDHYDLELYSGLNTQTLNALKEYNQNSLYIPYFYYGKKVTLTKYLGLVFKFSFGLKSVSVFILYLLLIFILISSKNYTGLCGVPFIFLLRSVSWIYPLIRGRAEERVTTSLFLCEVIGLCSLIVYELTQIKLTPVKQKLSLLLISFLALISICLNGVNLKELVDTRLNERASYKALTSYCNSHPENVYLLDVNKSTLCIDDLLDSPNKSENMILSGGWLSNSPIYSAFLAKYDINDTNALADKTGNVYFVADSVRGYDFLEEYYRDCGFDVSFEIVDTILADGYDYLIVHAY